MHDAFDHVELSFRLRGNGALARIRTQRIIDARSAQPLDEVRDGLVGRLLMRGLIRYDRHRLGIDANDALEVIDAGGHSVVRLWALGPIVRGVFWESTAVPDVRGQAVALAETVGNAMAQEKIFLPFAAPAE
jgi:uncharacterized NAD(P)/FAD-binding protein YdhS